MRLPDEETITVHPIGDTHIGHECCDLNYLLDVLKDIPDDEHHRIVLMGDLVDAGIKTAIGASVYENSLSPQKQIDTTVDIFKPYAKQIDALVMGNHEYRILKDTGIDVCKIIADKLEIPYLKYSGVVTYSMPHRAYNINIIHGKCGGSVENALRKCKDMSHKTVADIYLMGHVHQCAYTSRDINMIDSRNGKVVSGRQYFILTGHTLNYHESYAEQAGLEMSPKGFPIIQLLATKNKKINILTTH